MTRSRFRQGLRLVALGVASCAVLLAVRESLHRTWLRELDADLRGEAVELERSWRMTGAVSCCAALEPPADQPHAHSGQTYYEIRSGDGAVLARSPLLAKARWPDLPPDSLERFAWYHDFYLHRMRYVARRTVVGNAAPATIFFARDHGEFQQRVQDLDDLLAAILLAGAAGAFLLELRKRRLRWKTHAPSVPGLLFRLLTGSVILSSLILSLAGWATYEAVEAGWLEQMDRTLENRAMGVAALCTKVDGKWRLDPSHLESSVFRAPKSMQYFQARDGHGFEIARSASLGHLSFPAAALAPGERRFDWYHPGYLHKTRFVALSPIGGEPGLTVFFGQDYRDMKADLRGLRNLLIGIWISSEVLLSGLLALLVHLSLGPLRRIARRLDSLDETRLKDFPAEDAPREVRPLVDALSAALSRLDTAFQRERTLVADLAHEIRTPMAGIRTTLEVGIGDDEEHARRAMSTSLSILSRMQSLADSLLSLARLEGGQIPSSVASIDLAPLLEEAAGAWRPIFATRGIALEVSFPAPLPVAADPEWCRVVLRNLFENAAAHMRDGSRIALEASREGPIVAIRLSNDGSALEPTDAEKVFDRFWRKDDARAGAGIHAGLGLALCRELVGRMGGTLAARVPTAGEFRIEWEFPAA